MKLEAKGEAWKVETKKRWELKRFKGSKEGCGWRCRRKLGIPVGKGNHKERKAKRNTLANLGNQAAKKVVGSTWDGKHGVL